MNIPIKKQVWLAVSVLAVIILLAFTYTIRPSDFQSSTDTPLEAEQTSEATDQSIDPDATPSPTPTETKLNPTNNSNNYNGSKSSSEPVPTAKSGISGTVTHGPTCGGPTTEGTNCDNQPYETEIIISSLDYPSSADTLVKSDSKGAFTVVLGPGKYRIKKSNPSPFEVQTYDAVVTAGKYSNVNVYFDTGLR